MGNRLIEAGDAYGCKMFGHRHGWAGSVCRDAANWDCGARRDFRENYCAEGDDRCFHAHVFDEHQPQFMIDEPSSQWLLAPDGRALEDQILLFWGKRFKEPRGVVAAPADLVLYGAYRVKYVSRQRVTAFGREAWVIEPYEDGWVRFPVGPIKAPAFYHLDGSHFKGVPRSRLLRLFSEIDADLAHGTRRDWSEADKERFRHFHSHLEDWLAEAKTVAEAALPAAGEESEARPSPVRVPDLPEETSPFGVLRDFIPIKPAKDDRPPEAVNAPAERTPDAAVTAVGRELTARAPVETAAAALPEPAVSHLIESVYGRNTLRAVKVALSTKHLLILTGNPGTGKSRLANCLIDDTDNDRTLIVPVASTWRGRDDLLGYVNPVNGEFEPTAFTEFLLRAEAAWQDGDRRSRLVIFEEFNLSQPEHWFSDILARSEYSAEARASRTIALGGTAVRGHPGVPSQVFISPALYFVATINNDHTVRPLSPRVVDRASVIEIHCTAREALKRLGVSLEEPQVLAIEQLSMILEGKGLGFSVRSARSLRQSMQACAALDMSEWEILDLVLLQEVLSKVRLLIDDSGDKAVIEKLGEWCEQDFSKQLSECVGRIGDWVDMLAAGRDVVQV